jgi:hypothetical protein
MSLDVDLMVTKPCSVFTANITHNLGRMASEVKIYSGDSEVTLYDILWRPDEKGFTKANDIADMLGLGLVELVRFPEKYKQYNPENGWGSYEGLVQFVRQYHSACIDNMEAELQVSR